MSIWHKLQGEYYKYHNLLIIFNKIGLTLAPYRIHMLIR